MKICVFCASSADLSDSFYREAEELGRSIASAGWQIVYGGTKQGLMESLAKGAKEKNGYIKGIIPECIVEMGIADHGISELLIAPDMKQRKELMRESSDAFIALPGGWGTIEEISEVITLKQLGQHTKPIVFINTNGFYDSFLEFISQARDKHFISHKYDDLYQVVENVQEALNAIKEYKFSTVATKY
ncbi:TIGR00730 family Rossman fold protein [Odoribacter sp. OttesenSCG-928-J03]|nr:TIGR00730 family Rossman fold protein [Odoribacter sp. OttesenSCG-928-J03]MDL2330665.1 TIGR00730 family Rossman fold protein [Odoribacter sp. OttesenSCG-928-A06]